MTCPNELSEEQSLRCPICHPLFETPTDSTNDRISAQNNRKSAIRPDANWYGVGSQCPDRLSHENNAADDEG